MKMEIEKYKESENVYRLGDDAYDLRASFEYEWLVYDYGIGDYCGNGTAVALSKDGKLYMADLGHCSCYGPFDGDWTEVKLSDFQTDSIHDLGSSVTLEAVVVELMNRR
jgi:hypothetical protein